MQQIYLVLCVVTSIALSTPLFAQECSSLIKDAHQVAQAQLVRTKVQPLLLRGVESYSAQLLCDRSGLTLKMFTEGGRAFQPGDEIVFGGSGAFLNLAFTEFGERSRIGEAPVNVNTLQLDGKALDWLVDHPITTLYLRVPDREGLHKLTLPEGRRDQLREMLNCFAQTIDRGLLASSGSNAVEVTYPGATRPYGDYETRPVADLASEPSGHSGDAAVKGAAVAGLQADLAATRQEVAAQIAAERERLAVEKQRLNKEVENARAVTAEEVENQALAVVAARERAAEAISIAQTAADARIVEQREAHQLQLEERRQNFQARMAEVEAAEAEFESETANKIAAREEALRTKLSEIEAGERTLTEKLSARHAAEREQLVADFEAERERIRLARERLQAEFARERKAQEEALAKLRAEGEAALEALREQYAAEKKRIAAVTAALEGK